MKIFIVGGSSGIGLSLAKRYASLGNEVAICGTNEEKLKKIEEKQVEIIKFPPEKDYTDTEIAIMEAMKRGADTIYLFGGLGTRADHSLGNIGLLLTTKNKGARLLIVDDHNKMYLADKYIIAFVLKTIIIEENLSDIKNVLLLFQDAVINKKSAFNVYLKRYIPTVNFDVEPILFYQKDVATLKKNYDIIITDSKISYDSILIDSYSNIKIYEILENHALKRGLNKE